MKNCAFCDKPLNGTKTREHIIPNWYSEKDNVSFNERSNKKIGNDDIVIRDVCKNCNNVILSALDGYGKRMFEKYFQHPIFANQKTTFQYSFQKLSKWLLKISYNSARANKSDENILAHFRGYLISEENIPDELLFYVSTVAPSVKINEFETAPATKSDKDLIFSEIFRVSVTSFKDLSGLYWSFRVITIHSYRFFMAIPDVELVSNLKKESSKIESVLLSHDRGWKRLSKGGVVKLKKPNTDFVTEFLPHIHNNPVAVSKYLGEDGALTEPQMEFWDFLHQTKDEIIHVPISREDIEKRDFEFIKSVLNDLLGTRENVLKFLGRCEFSIFGYDDDSRELFEIKEVCEYLKVLDLEYPYWLVLQSPHGSWLRALYFCLGGAKLEGAGKIGISHSENTSLIKRWYNGLNKVTSSFAIPIAKNKQQSELVKNLLMPPS